jgi:hypothetical protein
MAFRFRQTAVVTILAFLFAGCEAVDNYVTKAANDSEQASDTSQTNASEATTTSTETTTSSGSSADEAAHGFNIASCAVKGSFDFRSAQITTTLTGCSMQGSRVSLTWEAHSWPYYDGACDGVVCAVWKTGSGWTGAYFDWAPAGRTSYTWGTGNLDNYVHLSSGDEVGFFLLSSDKKQRSNVLFTTWP